LNKIQLMRKKTRVKTHNTSTDYDNPWKEVLDVFFPQFMEFFYPVAYQEIDWTKGYISLDKELQKIVRDAKLGKRLADKLVRVTLKNGKKAIIIIHIEIQSEYESNFAERMFIYHYRIYDKYKKQNVEVVSLAVLGDDSGTWRPTEYKYSRWGCEMEFKFPIIKLIDYQQEILETTLNPFAIVVIGYLQAKKTTNNAEERLEKKLEIVKSMYEKGYERETVLQLFRLLDWMMILPEELTKKFDTEISDYEEEKKMPYVTSLERLYLERGEEIGREEGREEGILSNARQSILQVLEIRFQSVPKEISDRLDSISDLPKLQELHRLSVTISSVDDFVNLI
jgi:Putative transposase, YhgA-like